MIVGVATDEFCHDWKKAAPRMRWEDRYTVVSSLRQVDVAVPYSEVYPDAIYDGIGFDVFFVTDELMGTEIGMELEKRSWSNVYLPRQPGVSTTELLMSESEKEFNEISRTQLREMEDDSSCLPPWAL